MTKMTAQSTLSEKPLAEPTAVWVLTDGTVGMENQAVAVAEALGLPFAVKRVKRRGLVKAMPTWLQVLAPPTTLFGAIEPEGDTLAPPWPRLVISVGRHSVPLALAVKRISGGRTAALHIQNPQVPAGLFDLVAAPAHDGLSGANVVVTEGAPHRVTPARLQAEAALFATQVAPLPRPRVAVLIGGQSRAYRFDEADAAALGAHLRGLSERSGCGLLITPSRRTGPQNIAALVEALKISPALIWDGESANPYFGFLAHADAVIVTEDSVNMVTEAAGTGKPVYVYPMVGRSRRFHDFHARLRSLGVTRRFDGTLGSWSYAPINDSEKITVALRRLLGTRLSS